MPQAILKIHYNRPHLPPRSLHPSPESADCENDDGDDDDDSDNGDDGFDGDDGDGGSGVNVNDVGPGDIYR